jgi:alpha-beta hydrolase superfamily lysophospholipase
MASFPANPRQKIAASPPPPGPLAPSQTVQLASADGTALYGEWFAHPRPAAQAVVVHGYAEHCGRYRELAHVLHQAGLAVLGFDLRGHGRSAGQRGHVEQFADYLDDLAAAVQHAGALSGARSSAPLPLLLVGHSCGATVVLRALADPLRRPAHAIAAVLSSPFLQLRMQVSPVKRAAARIASRYLPRLTMPNGIDIADLTSDPERLAARRGDPLCHDVATSRWYTEVTRTQSWLTQFAHQIQLPTQWLVAGSDRIADTAAARALFAQLPTPGRYREFPDMYHEVFNERARALVYAELGEFLSEQLAGRPPERSSAECPETAENSAIPPS